MTDDDTTPSDETRTHDDAAQTPDMTRSAAPRAVAEHGTVAEQALAEQALAERAAGNREVPPLPPFTVVGYVRRARRRADMSQREMAKAAGIHASTVGRIESGELTPSLRVFRRLLSIGGMMLAVVDTLGHVVPPMQDLISARDGAERRYPSHLDTILDPVRGEWWGDAYGLARPPETFCRDRSRRDAQRRRSQWEVRVARHRGEPMPPLPRSYRWP